MKPFFITIDTEGDALWDNPTRIETENVLWIPKFQELCEKYEFIPIWLVDYEIICDDRFVNYIKEKVHKGLCEVGIHVHARNNPPIVSLEGEAKSGAAFLIEYPKEVMSKKFEYLKNLIEKKLEIQVITHRAGRWTLNQDYIDLLIEQKIKYDCSVTPGIDWSNCEGIISCNKGSNYTLYKNNSQVLKGRKGTLLTEYPVTIKKCNSLIVPDNINPKNILKSFYKFYKHTNIWLRPNTDGNLNEMKYILDNVNKSGEYAEFMIHSSELMPGGGPRHQGRKEIDGLFKTMDKLFQYAKQSGFKGYTFSSWEEERQSEG